MKKKTAFSFLAALLLGLPASAQEAQVVYPADSAHIPSLADIIDAESNLSYKRANEDHYKSVWGRTTFLNIDYTSTTFSSDNFPSGKGPFHNEFDNQLGLGIQVGNTYNFHKKPIGSVLFIGLDFTPVDINFNIYDKTQQPARYEQSSEKPYAMPWHNKKFTADYGMSLGPSLTLYPFTSIARSGTDNIRLHLYWHYGYCIGGALINDVDDPKSLKGDRSSELLWGHGSFSAWGASLSWGFIGVGYEARTNSSFNYRTISDNYKPAGKNQMKTKQTLGRLYLQFRF